MRSSPASGLDTAALTETPGVISLVARLAGGAIAISLLLGAAMSGMICGEVNAHPSHGACGLSVAAGLGSICNRVVRFGRRGELMESTAVVQTA